MATEQIKLIETNCPLCHSRYDKELYRANFDTRAFSYKIFSARRMPDKIHFRIVKCRHCGLVRSDPILEENTLKDLYSGSHFTYENESVFAAETYSHYYKKKLGHLGGEIKLLEIGCGNGSFLRKTSALGVKHLFGCEPSREAAEHAEGLKSQIHVGLFGPGIYPSNYFDVICAFQVFDHIADPNAFLRECHNSLRPQGTVLFINHNIGSLTAKILGEKCPMIDIEHTCLYDRKTFRKIFERNGFEVLKVFSVCNRYPLAYWFKLAPLPRDFKEKILGKLQGSKIGHIPISLKLGNMGIIAKVKKV